MRKISLYWIVTGLMAAFMALGALTDLAQTDMTKELVTGLGYPAYILPFLGVAKLLAVAAILYPHTPARLLEWAYAGLTFDLLAALYSHVRSRSEALDWLAALLALVLVLGSYALSLRRSGSAATTVERSENLRSETVS